MTTIQKILFVKYKAGRELFTDTIIWSLDIKFLI